MQGYGLQTEEAYPGWIKRFSLFSGKRHPQQMGVIEVRQFLIWLASSRTLCSYVALNTQKAALSALPYLYNTYLQQPLIPSV